MIHSHRYSRGFTIVEMLVATAILALVLSIAMGVMNGTSTMASQTTQRLDAGRVARESLDEIGRELSVAAIPWNRYGSTYSGSVSIGPTYSPQVLIDPVPNVLTGVQTAAGTDSIFWQAPLARSRDFGNLAIVGYFVLQDISDPNAANWRLQLRRVFVPPETAGIANSNYYLYSLAGGSTWNWISSALSLQYAAAGAVSDFNNAQQGWVADGVLGMWVRYLDRSGAMIDNDSGDSVVLTPGGANSYFNSRNAYTSPRLNNAAYDFYAYPASYSALPAYIQVAMVCVAPGEISHLKGVPAAPSAITTALTGTTFQTAVQTYVGNIRTANPGVKSVEAYSRTFRIYNSD